ncbi:hypothetical protein NMF40_17740, partial [Morganella morganii]|uniref:hypothetical protein n=1 Tax=Morganella morganii TaxID=582 RepID=UPI0027E1866E
AIKIIKLLFLFHRRKIHFPVAELISRIIINIIFTKECEHDLALLMLFAIIFIFNAHFCTMLRHGFFIISDINSIYPRTAVMTGVLTDR